MAEDPTHLIPIEEEIEGDRQGTSDFVFIRIGESVPLKPFDSHFDLDNPPSQPLAVSERHHLLFLAHSEGFLVARTKDVIGIAKEIKEKGKGPSVQGSCVVDVKIGRVSILAVSKDETTLAATVGGEIHFFDVTKLLNKVQNPLMSRALSDSGTIRDFKWQKNAEKSFIVLSSQGSLYGGSLEAHLKTVMADIDAVDWSVKGDFIAVARKNILRIFSSNFKEQLSFSLLFQSWSADTDSECPIKVDSIKWVRDDTIIIGCFRVNEDGSEEGYLVQGITSREHRFSEISCKPVAFSFPDPFDGIADDMMPSGSGPYLLASYLDCWELMLASNQKTIDQHVLLWKWLLDDNRMEVVFLEFNSDKYTPRIDLQENGDDNLILGFGVDKYSLLEKIGIQVDSEFKEVSPPCVLLCLTSEGKLIMYYAARISEPADLPQPSPSVDGNNYVKEKPLVFNSSKDEASETTSSLKIDVKGVALDNRFKQLSTEVSNAHKDTSMFRGENISSRQKQGGVNSQLGPLSRQVANSNKSSAQSSLIQSSAFSMKTDIKPCTPMLSQPSAERGVNSSLSMGNVASEAATIRQGSTKDSVKGLEAGKGFGSPTIGGAPFGLQSTGSLFGLDGSIGKFSAFGSSRSVLNDGQDKAEQNSMSTEFRSLGQSNLKGSKTGPPSVMFSYSKASQNKGDTISSFRTGDADAMPAIQDSPASSQEGSFSRKSQHTRAQPLLENVRASRSMISDSEPELSKQFYNVKSMVKELDSLLSFIEKEGGFRDACTVLQKSGLSALENGLHDLSKTSHMCMKKLAEHITEIEDLQNKMFRVSARQVYMKGLLEQASNGKYWDIWNRQKLRPEFEAKRQHILNMKQNLTNQLIELERYFNTVEISRFGETAKIPADRRFSRSSLEASRQIQPLHNVYNTLTSQLAAADHLSDCLSKQMSALNINSHSVKRQNVAEELFESIGLSHETSVIKSPDSKRFSLSPDSINRTLHSTNDGIKDYPWKNTSSGLKASEPESARRRRDSLDRTWAAFEPSKTRVKRIGREERSRVSADGPFRKAKEAFDSQMEAFASQQKGNATHASRFPLGEGILEDRFKQVSEVQSNSVFKSQNNFSGSSRNVGSNSRAMHVTQGTAIQSSSLMPLSAAKFSSAPSNPKAISDSSPSIGSIHVGQQSISSAARAFSVSKTIPSMQLEVSTTAQTSSTFSSTVSPMNTRPTAGVMGQMNLKIKDEVFASSVPESIKELADSSESISAITNETSISPSFSISAVNPSSLNENIFQLNKMTNKNQPTESTSTFASHPKVSVSTPFSPAPFAVPTTSATVSTTSSMPASLSSISSALSTKPAGITNLASSPFTSTSFTSVSSQTQNSLLSTTTSQKAPPLAPTMFGRPSLDTNQAASVTTPTSAASSHSPLSSSSLGYTQSQNSLVSTAFAASGAVSQSPKSHLNDVSSKSEPNAPVVPANEVSLQLNKINSKSEATTPQTPATKDLVREPKMESSLLPASSASVFGAAASFQLDMAASVTPPSGTTTIEKDAGSDAVLSQEDEMEEEASDTTTVLNLGSLGGFGLGSAPPSSTPKPNPFGGSFLTAHSTTASPSLSLTASPGEPFRPASFTLPSAQPVQTSQPVNSGGFSSGLGRGFSGFGQPAQVGSGQQALGSVLGTFGQSRQLGSGMPGVGFGSSGGFSGGGFSPVSSSPGFTTGGGFGSAPAGGGFTSVASGGGGFAAAAKGGGFGALASSSGGFAGAAAGGATGGGFAALASSGSAFGAATPAGSGFGGAAPGGGFAPGGFASFGSNLQGGGFSAFGGSSATGAGKPPAALLTQMRK